MGKIDLPLAVYSPSVSFSVWMHIKNWAINSFNRMYNVIWVCVVLNARIE